MQRIKEGDEEGLRRLPFSCMYFTAFYYTQIRLMMAIIAGHARSLPKLLPTISYGEESSNSQLHPKAFQNGMLIAKTGAMDTLLEVALQQIKSTSLLPSLCIARKNLAVNDKICKSVADKGGLELVMKFITTSREQNHKIMARSACILLIQ
ncbi:unnamed protein product [Calypogeia fissa]